MRLMKLTNDMRSPGAVREQQMIEDVAARQLLFQFDF
jgi:hypothetical protein